MYKERIASCDQRIAQALTLKGMRQAELCKRAKIPKSSLSLYLRGAYEPKQDRLHDMAIVLNVSEARLMGYDVPMERQEKNPPNEPTLTEGEKKVLELFRLIPEERQGYALEVLETLLKMQQKP
jgi:transcriptional regulator with XRE-family HTH domain